MQVTLNPGCAVIQARVAFEVRLDPLCRRRLAFFGWRLLCVIKIKHYNPLL